MKIWKKKDFKDIKSIIEESIFNYTFNNLIDFLYDAGWLYYIDAFRLNEYNMKYNIMCSEYERL